MIKRSDLYIFYSARNVINCTFPSRLSNLNIHETCILDILYASHMDLSIGFKLLNSLPAAFAASLTAYKRTK